MQSTGRPCVSIEDALDLIPVNAHPVGAPEASLACGGCPPHTSTGPVEQAFTTPRPLWRPPGSRGIFGGILIGQSLMAALRTVLADAVPTSMHCYFIFAGDSDLPVIYHVERVVDHFERAVRIVRAKQREKLILIATVSICSSCIAVGLDHSRPAPAIEPPPLKDAGDNGRAWNSDLPYESFIAGFIHNSYPENRKFRQWARAKGQISLTGGRRAHLGALAYMSDSFLLATVYRIHSTPRFSSKTALRKIERLKASKADAEALRYLQSLADEEVRELGDLSKADKEVSMMVSLSHSIYFHHPDAVRADEWMIAEMESPWSGDGRGLAFSHWWSKDGILIASCTQEGIMRLSEDSVELMAAISRDEKL